MWILYKHKTFYFFNNEWDQANNVCLYVHKKVIFIISDLNPLTNSYLTFTWFERRMIRRKSSMILKLKQIIKKLLEIQNKRNLLFNSYHYHATYCTIIKSTRQNYVYILRIRDKMYTETIIKFNCYHKALNNTYHNIQYSALCQLQCMPLWW